jgi:hypothetical protein
MINIIRALEVLDYYYTNTSRAIGSTCLKPLRLLVASRRVCNSRHCSHAATFVPQI